MIHLQLVSTIHTQKKTSDCLYKTSMPDIIFVAGLAIAIDWLLKPFRCNLIIKMKWPKANDKVLLENR